MIQTPAHQDLHLAIRMALSEVAVLSEAQVITSVSFGKMTNTVQYNAIYILSVVLK